MQLRIKVQVGGDAVFIGRNGRNWIISNKDDTEAESAAVLEAAGQFSILESVLKFKKYAESYAHIESGECH